MVKKRKLILLFMLVLSIALIGVGCNQEQEDTADEHVQKPENQAGEEKEVEYIDQGKYPAEIRREGNVVYVKMYTTQNKIEIADGKYYQGWTFDGEVPGPVIRVKEGDLVKFTLVNKDTMMPHSMDFHSAITPWDKSYVDVAPGESFSFEFEAKYPGTFMYHCGTAPTIAHIANGMYGAIIVDPVSEPQFEEAREFVLVQSEFYKDAHDIDDMVKGEPQVVAFNGKAFKYDHDNPLEAKPNELVRLYVVNAGPNNFSAFHIVGAIFEKVYINGNPKNVEYGVQTVTIPPGGSAVVELRLPEEGYYPIVSHSFKDATLGATGFLRITEDAKDQPLAP